METIQDAILLLSVARIYARYTSLSPTSQEYQAIKQLEQDLLSKIKEIWEESLNDNLGQNQTIKLASLTINDLYNEFLLKKAESTQQKKRQAETSSSFKIASSITTPIVQPTFFEQETFAADCLQSSFNKESFDTVAKIIRKDEKISSSLGGLYQACKEILNSNKTAQEMAFLPDEFENYGTQSSKLLVALTKLNESNKNDPQTLNKINLAISRTFVCAKHSRAFFTFSIADFLQLASGEQDLLTFLIQKLKGLSTLNNKESKAEIVKQLEAIYEFIPYYPIISQFLDENVQKASSKDSIFPFGLTKLLSGNLSEGNHKPLNEFLSSVQKRLSYQFTRPQRLLMLLETLQKFCSVLQTTSASVLNDQEKQVVILLNNIIEKLREKNNLIDSTQAVKDFQMRLSDLVGQIRRTQNSISASHLLYSDQIEKTYKVFNKQANRLRDEPLSATQYLSILESIEEIWTDDTDRLIWSDIFIFNQSEMLNKLLQNRHKKFKHSFVFTIDHACLTYLNEDLEQRETKLTDAHIEILNEINSSLGKNEQPPIHERGCSSDQVQALWKIIRTDEVFPVKIISQQKIKYDKNLKSIAEIFQYYLRHANKQHDKRDELLTLSLKEAINKWELSFGLSLAPSTNQLTELAISLGCRLVNVPADGRCLYHAVLYQLQHSRNHQLYAEWTVHDLVIRSVEYIIANQDKFVDFIQGDIHLFLDGIMEGKIWADHIIIQALSNALNTNIVIINSDQSRPIEMKQLNAAQTIYLAYQINYHYQALVADSNNEEMEQKLNDYLLNYKQPELIDPQEINVHKKFLGSGSTGMVYKATYQNRTVAVKQLRMTASDIESLKKEASIIAKLSSPYIVQLYGVSICQVTDNYSLVMEYADNGSLHHYLCGQNTTYWKNHEEVQIDLAHDISKGLAYLHSKNVLHRDLKSQNVLITSKGRAKLCDFNLSKIWQESGVESTFDGGTLRWMAPELLSPFDRPIYTFKSDIYSFAMTLWEIFTPGKFPYHDGNVNALSGQVFGGKRETIPANVRPRVAHLIAKCWEQRGEDRPTAARVVHKIDKIKQEKEREEASTSLKR